MDKNQVSIKQLQLEYVNPEAAASLRRMQELHAERNTPVTTQDQLPFWRDEVRAAPNTLLRSAFFAPIRRNRREIGKRVNPDEPKQGVTIAAQHGIRISFAGDELNQYDADVFFEALHRARHHPLETECIFTGYDFLKAIGRAAGKLNYQDLNNSLTRLRDGRAEIEWEVKHRSFQFVGGLIASYLRERNSRLYKITFANEIRHLFASACWTELEWKQRLALQGRPLAQWLHSFYSTHARPFPLSVAYLYKTSGSRSKQLKNFRTDLRHAVEIMQSTLGWQSTWEGDLLTIIRQPIPGRTRNVQAAITGAAKLFS